MHFFLYKGINTETGTYTKIRMNRVFSKHLPYPYSTCSEDIETSQSELVQKLLKTGYKYTQKDCFALCLQRI